MFLCCYQKEIKTKRKKERKEKKRNFLYFMPILVAKYLRALHIAGTFPLAIKFLHSCLASPCD